MITLVLRVLGQYWVLIGGALLIGAVAFQGNLLVEKNQQIQSLEIAARMLHEQLVQHQRKAEIVDRLRHQMHIETISLRDELRERQLSSSAAVEAIMLQPVSRKEYESIQWLHESIKNLGFAPEPGRP